MYYVIEKEFVGHADFGTGYDKLVNGHFFEVRTEPGRKNMSNEVAIGRPDEPVWLGTTNDWAAYARGSYDTEDAAIANACALAEAAGHGHRFSDTGEPGALDGYPRAYVGDDEWANVVDAGEWLAEIGDDELGIHADMSEDEIDAAIVVINDIAHDDGVRLWGTESFIRERIDQLSDEDED